ncbi:putative UDP-glucose glucosyltransferase isoform X6 [Malus sylvestris]|uniref:putative UDP-glucose glucosyltransferase isoform X6 n=1 Tax=Malus sylvestris TaxID=3752 RepID=UPI0021ACE550|nr:putative UDP-glucose glucosyltransferase isoform X6 [Malus sylvestris]
MGTEIIPAHMVLVCFPGQGHINPMLRLGKRLAAKGFLVSFSTTENFGKEMRAANSGISDEPTPVGDGFIRFEFFDDGLPEQDPKRTDLDYYMPQLELVGKDLVTQMIKRHANEGRPVSCLVNNPFIPWVCDIGTELGIPRATLWVQSCAVFSAYYHYHSKAVWFPTETEPNLDVQLPGMPILKHDEIPSFLHPFDRFQVLGRAILGQFKKLSKSIYVLIDTFQELEPEVIEHMSQFCIVKPVGPLFKNPKPPQTTISGDLMKADDCLEWLDSKPPTSVVYISFGSIVYLKQEQVDEIAHGLLSSGVSFLWVMKPPIKECGFEEHVLPDKFLEKVGDKGKVVKWSPQEQVLAHPSIACFVTHCGWNSSVEALTSGVPVVTFPQWGDQVTNAKFLVDVFGVGLRLSRGAAENRLSMRDEIGKCLLEATVGHKAIELKQNALKWKLAAESAVAEGGSSDQNLQDFLDEIIFRSFKLDFS